MTDDPINHRDPTGEAGEPGERMAGIFTGLEMSEEHAEQLVEAELYRCQMLWGLSREVCATIPSDYASGVAVGSALKGMTAADIQNAVAAHVDTVKGVLGAAGLKSVAAIVPIVPRARTSGGQAWRDLLGSVLDDERTPPPISVASPVPPSPVDKLLSGVPGEDFVPNPAVTSPYVRPSQAGPTKAQKQFVQGKPCVDCGAVTAAQVADHIDPLSVEYYRTGKVDVMHQSSTKAVQPHCPGCSNKQGGQLSAFARRMKKLLKL